MSRWFRIGVFTCVSFPLAMTCTHFIDGTNAVIAQEEDEEEDDFSPGTILRERLRDLRELKESLEDAEEERSLITGSIRQCELEIKLLEKIVGLQRSLDKAEDGDDEDSIEELEEAVEAATWEFEKTQHIGEIEEGLREGNFELRIAREERDRPGIVFFTDIIKTRQQLLSLVKQLHKVYEDGPERLEGPLEEATEMLERVVWLKELRSEFEERAQEEPSRKNKAQVTHSVELLKIHNHFLSVNAELLKAKQNAQRQKYEDLEEQLDEIREELEPLWGVFELELELKEAREEGDRELIQELEEELKALRGEKTSVIVPQPAVIAKITSQEMANAVEFHFQRDIFPLLTKYCIRCHGQEVQEGELNFAKSIAETPFVRNSRLWLNVAEQTRNRVMPPDDEPQPTDQERRLIAAWILNAIKNFDYSKVDNPGYEPTRRLTHQEYNNTVRDLFGVEVQVTDKFPADLSAISGFDNSANSLFIQPLLLERYMSAADEVIRQVLPDDSEKQNTNEFLTALISGPPKDVASDRAAKQVIDQFLPRAYRREVTASEVEKSLKQFQTLQTQGISYRDAIKHVLRATLVSPKFLMKNESAADAKEAFVVDNWQLANRLSYFLWASMPDEELFRLARQGELSKPGVLHAQVDRMLANSKADTLGTIFASQWLGFQHLGSRVRADPIDNPWCTDSLMNAMKSETALFFMAQVRDNRPLPELVTANYTFLNAELARHYDLPGVKGNKMRRVTLNTPTRGGIFTHGSLLAVTSFPGRTSPVVRGKWILEEVLGTPPPPPPPNVSEFSDEIEDRESLTRRQKLELHRKNPNCYSCHSQIDPLGFSLENYDWFGRYQSHRRRRKIDASGHLPDGTEFRGAEGLKRVIVEKRLPDLTRQVSRKMLSYALGRQLEYYDEPAVRKITAALEEDDYRMATLIHQIVVSYPFRYKKQQDES
ncbi:MAG: hypothetical protein CMJ78_01785 [Planctomycetaceae bacterium]|nr:hypothetical protein [Planctomycetaceae bacterium]